MRLLLILFISFSIFSCSQMTGVGGLTPKQEFNDKGDLIANGFTANEVTEGTWTTYYDGDRNKGKIKTVSGYHNGNMHGVYLEFNDRGQLNMSANYINGVLEGEWAKYDYGRIEESATYKNGLLDGVYRKFYRKPGAVQIEANYKGGKQHGIYRFYGEDGQVQLEYEYKNGEKVGGGMVEPEAEKTEE